MISKPLVSITLEDITDLIKTKATETMTLEFKRSLPEASESGRAKFLACVSSLANTNGGDVVFGVSTEEDGVANEISGVGTANQDKEVLRLDACMRDCLDPRLTAHEWKWIPTNGSYVVVLRIARSWNGPHRVTLGGTSRFYARQSNGKYEMNSAQLRMAFAASDNEARQIQSWRDERVARILGQTAPLRMNPARRIVMHIVPLCSLYNKHYVHVKQQHLHLDCFSRHMLAELDNALISTVILLQAERMTNPT